MSAYRCGRCGQDFKHVMEYITTHLMDCPAKAEVAPMKPAESPLKCTAGSSMDYEANYGHERKINEQITRENIALHEENKVLLDNISKLKAALKAVL